LIVVNVLIKLTIQMLTSEFEIISECLRF